MRAAPLALLPLASLALATSALAGPMEGPAPTAVPPTELSILSQRSAEESMARQAEFDRRIAERSNRAARSICSGCGAGATAASRGATVTPGLRNPGTSEVIPDDPSQAPLH